ncbi:MAG: hypothetical protein KDB82_11770 [Planctomycetes bacterium]|nr:hypothetical protein [Planctomycetota bacterium]
MKQPEDWVVATAENAKRELSIVLSMLLPLCALTAASMPLWLSSNDGGTALAAVVLFAIPCAAPLAIIGFINQGHRDRRVTIPVNIACLLLLAGVAAFVV